MKFTLLTLEVSHWFSPNHVPFRQLTNVVIGGSPLEYVAKANRDDRAVPGKGTWKSYVLVAVHKVTAKELAAIHLAGGGLEMTAEVADKACKQTQVDGG